MTFFSIEYVYFQYFKDTFLIKPTYFNNMFNAGPLL